MMRKGIIASILIFSISLSFGQSINDKNLKQINSSINLFKTSYSESKNTLISPISVSIAMAMAYEGAKGETAKEFMNILSFAKNKTKHRKFYSETIKELNSSSQSQLKIANIIVAQKNYSFLKRYFKNLKAYETLVKYADFANPEERKKTQEDINNWVSENTKNKIKNLIKENSFDHLTRLVIV
ncbi:MAG: serpin family protein, partial [Bacteroidales bacterium]|nr:serpin family protein [Bacteroidales bacterium]